MRGQQEATGSLFSYVSIEDRIPASHPLRRIRKLAEQALDRLNPTFCKLYASEGRPSVPPEQLLLASLLQAWASHASLERIDGEDDPPPPPSGPGEGFGGPKDGKKRAKGDFRGVRLSNKTHRSSTDPDALLARKSNVHPALPSYRGHVLMDNRHALVVDCRVTQADGYGERDAAKAMAADLPGRHQKTIGADKHYDTRGLVSEMRRIGITPHVARNHCCVRTACDRLQPDSTGQPSQTLGGDGMNRPFSRRRSRQGESTTAKSLSPMVTAAQT